MIRVVVKLYGTLAWRFQDYDPENGILLELPQGARVVELTRQLNLVPEETGVVALDGRVATPHDPLYNGAQIRIFQISHGG